MFLRVLGIGAGMLGLAAIGLLAGAPRAERVELMSLAPGLDGSWLAGAPEATTPSSASPLEATTPAVVEATSQPVTPSAEPSATNLEADETPPPPPPGITKDGKVILNTASASELVRLPGIGQKRAEKILALRERLKRFRKLTDLLRVKGIGPKSLRKMLPHLVLDPPEPEPAPSE